MVGAMVDARSLLVLGLLGSKVRVGLGFRYSTKFMYNDSLL